MGSGGIRRVLEVEALTVICAPCSGVGNNTTADFETQ